MYVYYKGNVKSPDCLYFLSSGKQIDGKEATRLIFYCGYGLKRKPVL
mgnify:FL=1